MKETTINFFELLVAVTDKELRTRYKYTVFGFLWIVLMPLFQMLVIGFIFTFFIREPIKNYYYFLYIGLLLWNFFSISLAKATPSIVYDRDLVTRAKFPRMIIPLSIILANLAHFLLGLAIVALVLLGRGSIGFFGLAITLLATFWLFVLTIGVSLIATTLNVRYRDINFFVQAMLILWFYATPIVYPLSFIDADVLWVWSLNPLTSVIQLFHWGMLGMAPPLPETVYLNAVETILITGIGFYIFAKESKNFADWI